MVSQAVGRSEGTVIVLDGLPYGVVVSGDGAAEAARFAARAGRSAVLVYDRRLGARALALREALAAVGLRLLGEIALAAGERHKTLRAAEQLLRWLASTPAERGTVLVALGGGTVTDLAGFAAASYLRGIPWLAVPTTVLGMVDAAIGGKTGVDMAEGKNLVGAFWPPIGVVADLEALRTLPRRQRATGMAEIIKSAIIGDAALFEMLERRGGRALKAETIAAAARVKIGVVAADPRERGARAALNLGHTLGHALEAASAYKMAHGDAVAIGMRAAGLLALRQGTWSRNEHARLLNVLVKCKLPLSYGDLAPGAIMNAMRRDKKRVDGEVRFVLPVRIGEVKTGVTVDAGALAAVVARCAAAPGPDERL
jgi:3-dehydroquinate synthase